MSRWTSHLAFSKRHGWMRICPKKTFPFSGLVRQFVPAAQALAGEEAFSASWSYRKFLCAEVAIAFPRWRRSDISTSELKSWLQPKNHRVVQEVAERPPAGRPEAENRHREPGRVLASVAQPAKVRLEKVELVKSPRLASRLERERAPLEREPLHVSLEVPGQAQLQNVLRLRRSQSPSGCSALRLA